MNKLLRLVVLPALTMRLMAIDPAAGHMIEALPARDFGQELYVQHCIRCHDANHLGVDSAPLTPWALGVYQIKDLIAKLQTHCSGNPHSPYLMLEIWQQIKIIRYLQATYHTMPSHFPDS